MRSRVVNLLPAGLMLLLALLTLWLRQAIEAPGTPETRTGPRDPDAIVEAPRMTRLDAAGKPQYMISARRLVHYPADDSTELVLPRLTRQIEAGRLTVTAARGRITRDNDEAFFHDNVELVRSAAADGREMRMQTEYLHVLAGQDLVRSDRLVTITEGATVLSGVGMEYNKRSNQFQLKSRVKGSFDVAKKR